MSPAAPAAALLLGAFSVLAQTLLARELLPLFHGSELSLGLVIAAWLLLGALGSHLAGRAPAGRVPPLAAAAAAAVALPAAVLAARAAAGWLPAPPGTVPGLRAAGPAVAGIIAAVAAPCGAWFALAAGGGDRGRPGRVHAWESAGGLAAGAAFTALLAGRVDGLAVAVGASAALLAAAGCLAARPAGPRQCLGVAAVAVAALLAAASGPLDRAARASQAARLPGLAVVDARDARTGALALVRRGDQLTLFANGAPGFSLPDPETAVAAAHLPLLAAPAVGRVLVAGGCAGGVLAEVLRHPVREVDCVEADPATVPLVRPHLPPPVAAALADPRARLHAGDLRAFLAARPGRYDALLLGTLEPATAAANRLVTREFFDLARRALAPGGVAAVALAASPNYHGPRLLLRNVAVRTALAGAFPRVEVLATEPLTLLASAAPAPLADAATLAGRIAGRGIPPEAAAPEVVGARLDPARAAFAARELEAAVAAENRDLAPSAYYHHLRYREALEGDASAAAAVPPPAAARWGLLALPLLLAAPLLAGPAAARRERALGAAAAATGFAAMALQFLVLFAYQTTRGALAGSLGALSGAFMAGLAGGGFVALRLLRRGTAPARLLAAAEAALAVLPAAAALGFLALRALGAGPAPAAADGAAAAIALLCGAAAGFEFPLLAPASAREPARVAARSYALDLAGAATGVLAVSLGALPLFGLWWSLALVAAVKLASLGLVATAFRGSSRRGAETDG